MIELNLGSLFKGFNISKFVINLSALCFVVLLSLKLDDHLPVNWAFIFTPLWLCNILVFIGAVVASVSYCCRPPASNDIALRTDFYSMLFTTLEHIFLFILVALIFVKIEYGSDSGIFMPWIIVLSPLIFLSLITVIVCVWSLRHDKSFEFEFIISINVLQTIFVAFKLDNEIDWSWAVVFIPFWVILSLSAVAVLYGLVLSIVLARSTHLVTAHRRHHVYSSLVHTLFVIPALICLILLTGKLDMLQWSDVDRSTMPFTAVFFPLIVSLFCMLLMSFGHGGNNVWWFGLRRPFCAFVLDSCPCLQQYANVSYKFGLPNERNTTDGGRTETEEVGLLRQRNEPDRQSKPVMPIVSIESPD